MKETDMGTRSETGIIIAPLQQVEHVLTRWPEAWIVGLLGPEMAHPELPSVPQERRLRLALHDVDARREGHVAAQPQQLLALIDFARHWRSAAADGDAGPLLIHCWFGISRSPAAAFIVQCALRPDVSEMALAQRLRQLLPQATPNRHMVALADALLGRQGRMQQAVRTIGRGLSVELAVGDGVACWPLDDEAAENGLAVGGSA